MTELRTGHAFVPRRRSSNVNALLRGTKALAGSFLLLFLTAGTRGSEPAQAQQETEVKQEGWLAQWIWLGGEPAPSMLLARREFTLHQAPETARLRITASSVYQLYVNDRYVGRGPARCAPHHQSYDDIDVTQELREGRNTLAVRVHYQEGTVSYHHSGRAGLLAQLDVDLGGLEKTIATDRSWRVLADPAWDASSPRMSRFHPELCDRVDLRRRPGDWKSIGYDDSGWDRATPLMRNVGWPAPQPDSKPHALTPPWTLLERRDIPYLKERDVATPRPVEALPIADEAFEFGMPEKDGIRIIKAVALTSRIDPAIQQAFDRSGSLVIPPARGEGWFLLYDLGTVLNGMPRLDIEGPAGTVVDVMCGPYIVGDRFTANIVDSQWIDRVVLSGRRDRWEATYFKPTRFMGIVIRGATGPVTLREIGIHQMAYPFDLKGSLRTPGNPWLEACWKAAAKTIQVCTTDAYTDNYRERRQYVQTAYYAALGNYWTYGDLALQRRCLKQAAEEQEANGMMPAYAPRFGDDYMVILDSNTAWLRGLRDYLLYSGDDAIARELLPAGRKLMSLLIAYTNELGLLDNPPYPYWLDHALIDRRGANFCMNGQYLGALESFADLLEWLEESGADEFRFRAGRLRQALREKFWNPERQLFSDALVDQKQSGMFSEQTNAMALAMGIATGEQARAIAAQLLLDDDGSYIRRDGGMTMVTPAMSWFLHAGLCRYGFVKESLALLEKRFGKMLLPETNQTLWEEWWLDGTGRTGRFVKRTRSDAQTESAFPPALFGQYVLGIRPLKPGLREVELSRPECGLSEIEGSLPTPAGRLSVRWNLKEGHLQVEVPEGIQVRLNFPTTSGAGVLSTGKHSVRF